MKRYKPLFENKLQQAYELFYKSGPGKLGYDWQHVINDLIQELKQYERDNNKKRLYPFKKYLGTGLENILFSNKKYIVYKGLFLTKQEGYINSTNYEKIKKTKKFYDSLPTLSWTTDKTIAINFARGSTHWMDIPKLDKEYYQDGNYFGIILEYKPSKEEILIDFNYAKDQGIWIPGFSEDEVIIFPKIKVFNVEEIIEK